MKITYTPGASWELLDRIEGRLKYFQNILDSKQLEVTCETTWFERLFLNEQRGVLTRKSEDMIWAAKYYITKLKKLKHQVEKFQFSSAEELILSEEEVDSLTQELCTC